MSLSCSFCQHVNPADAKFCNECGAPRHLAPCARCEAINDVHVDRCHACGEPLRAPAAVEPAHAEDAPSPARSSFVDALETIEADMAPMARRGTRGHADHRLVLAPPARRRQAKRMRPLRPILFAVFVGCALATVLLGERLPLPAALSRASLATALVVPAQIAEGAGAQGSTPLPSLPAQATSRTRGGPIQAIAPDTASQPPEPCSDGVAALALCNREDASDVR